MLIRAATRGQVEDGTLAYFHAALESLDYQTALAAATVGTITWRVFPSWAEFKEIYRSQERTKKTAAEQAPTPPPQPQGRREATVEWVWVWSWCRTERQPRNLRAFPQQHGFADPADMMTNEEYEALREEWVAAGSPKAKDPLPVSR